MDHTYALELTWTGNRGSGTSGYRDYGRDLTVVAPGKPELLGSADPSFRGDAGRWNPEELLVAALSQCHLLSYLHMAVTNGVTVAAYADSPVGTMEQAGVGGRFTRVLLRPRVTITDPDQVELATRIHRDASEACFIASSVNFPVDHEPVIEVAS
ncbi:MAG TPA: OsmC family protein [Nocardioides sp.]|nr:OsmC family protein [Nocardioides sp.]